MGFIELLLIAIGLSMDAFAVSVCKGLNMQKINYKHTFWIALYFGGFQALMPLIGWALGTQFEKYITNIDHWIAFALLSIIGVQMILEATKKDDDTSSSNDNDNDNNKINHKELFTLAIATSIDALTIGITFAFLQVSILTPITVIGICTFILSWIGVIIGNKFGAKYKSKAELCGGIILILIGLKVLLEHLGILNL